MAEFVVNLVLIVAVLMLLTAWAFNAHRHRRRARRQHAAERCLILNTLANAATVPTVRTEAEAQPTHECGTDARLNSPVARERLDTAAVAALLDLLEDRRPVARGILASLIASPRTVWSAGTRAGQSLGRRTTATQRDGRSSSEVNADLYRNAAAELVDIHAHDPSDAQREYRHYATVLPDHAPQIVGDITGSQKSQPRTAHSSQPTR